MRILRNSLWLFLSYTLSVIAASPWGVINPTPGNGGIYVFNPSTNNLQATLDAIYSDIGSSDANQFQFNNNRYVLFFLPGDYGSINSNLLVNVGYYTSVIGLGETPQDTQIPNVMSPEENDSVTIGALNTFWRSAENFYTAPTLAAWSGGPTGMAWAVSQACPLRKVYVDGTLWLFQVPTGASGAGFASGGFMADCTTTGQISPGSQQQWFTRNTDIPSWSNGVWNMVFVGCNGAPPSNCGNCPPNFTCNPYTTVAATPLIAEKPYIVADPTGTDWSLMIPQVEMNKVGTSLDNNTPVQSVPFDNNVYVAFPANDTAASISTQIAAGNHIILTPGIYNLDGSIEVNNPNVVILGIGFPTLISTTGQPCIVVGSVSGVRIGGILLQAGPNPTPTLLQWGPEGGDSSITSGFLYDCFARVGRFQNNDPDQPFNQTDIMVQINSSNIVCDNLWLWRADHDAVDTEVKNSNNPCNTGFQVNGDHVIAYGLAVEHTLQNLTEWNGDYGQCYFYQSEYPYDVSQQNYGDLGYVSYKVGNSVTHHSAWGVGVYCFFRDFDVTVQSGIGAPLGQNIQFINPLIRYLNGNGGIEHVINRTLTGILDPVTAENPGPTYFCDIPLPTQNPRSRIVRRFHN